MRQPTEEKSLLVRGMWHDTYRYLDGREEYAGGEFEWRDNQIQNSFATLLAAWARAEPGYDRIGFMGLGTGLVAWDTTPPAQPFAQATLETEAFRKAIPQGNLIFIDPGTNLPTGGTPSPKLEITTIIGTGEANGLSLREFGLFGGTATIAFDSGEQTNWVVHQRIDKDNSFEIDRIIRLEFVTQ